MRFNLSIRLREDTGLPAATRTDALPDHKQEKILAAIGSTVLNVAKEWDDSFTYTDEITTISLSGDISCVKVVKTAIPRPTEVGGHSSSSSQHSSQPSSSSSSLDSHARTPSQASKDRKEHEAAHLAKSTGKPQLISSRRRK